MIDGGTPDERECRVTSQTGETETDRGRCCCSDNEVPVWISVSQKSRNRTLDASEEIGPPTLLYMAIHANNISTIRKTLQKINYY